jgi:tRNA-uridine 2-sulfurtransferase
MTKKKCIVLFSGGLDSRLVVKIMQEQGFEVIAVYFRLPFGCGCCDPTGCSFNFTQVQGIKLEIFDCMKGKLLQEYMEVLKKGEHGRGASVNPCRDCKIFMFERAREYGKKLGIDLIVTGEVLGERPMSQLRKSMDLIEDKSKLKGKLLRPLSAKLLPETDAEKQGLVDREKLYDIHGRRREKQMALAKKFKIKYPSPAGGCLLCAKELKKRFEFLFERGLDEKEVLIAQIGRHFIINNCWIVLGRNKEENKVIEDLKHGEVISPEFLGPTATILDKHNKDTRGLVEELIFAYSKQGSEKDKKMFEEYKL